MENFDAAKYWENRLNENYNLHGVGFIGHGPAYNDFMYRVRKKVFHKTISKTISISKEKSVLDIGSGTGFYIRCWEETGLKDIEGSDITQVAVEQLTKNFPTYSFQQLDIGSNTFPHNKKYDIISAFDVLFHIVDDEAFERSVANISSLLKPGGKFIVSDNFIHGPETRTTHHVSRTIEKYTDVLKKNGFEIEYRKPVFYFMNTPVDGERKFLKWFWNLQSKIIYRGKHWARILSAIIYPVELFMVAICKEGPSTEIMVCKKVQ